MDFTLDFCHLSESRHPDFARDLFVSAFPPEERYDFDLVYYRDSEVFHFFVVSGADVPLGIISYNDFVDFIYVEHFAVHESLRGRGYGQRIITEFFAQHGDKQVVLEVELPEDVDSRRRIDFYRCQGMTLNTQCYWQPSYIEKRLVLPMCLMSRTPLDDSQFVFCRDTIYHRVYRYEGPAMPL